MNEQIAIIEGPGKIIHLPIDSDGCLEQKSSLHLTLFMIQSLGVAEESP